MIRNTVSLSLALSLASFAVAGCNPAETNAPIDQEPTPDEEHVAGPFVVQPGEDTTICTYVRSDSDSEQDITAFLTEQTKGGHHLIVYTIDHPIDAPPFKCSQGGQPSWNQVLVTQHEDEKIEFPEGVGFHVEPHQQYVMETHYINVTSEPIDVTSHFKVVYGEPGTVKERAATYFFGTMNINIPPMSSAEKTASCRPPRPMSLRTMFGHQHRMGVRLGVTHAPSGAKASEVYQSTDWEYPEILSFDGGLDLTEEDTLSVTCNWNNTGSNKLQYPHEMCFAIGYFWPADAGLFCGTGGGDDETCVCREQGTLDTGPGGAAVQISLTRKAEIPGAGGELDAGAPIYCSLFRAEDYGPFGPKEGTEPYYFRDVVDLPLVTEEDVAVFDVNDVTPGDYKVSCMMDVIGGGFFPGKGDVVNLTAPAVTVKKGEVAHVEAQLDFAIP